MYYYPTEAGPHKICKSVYQHLFVCLLFGWSVCSVHTVDESMGNSLQTATYYNRDTSAELKHQVTHTACNLHAFLFVVRGQFLLRLHPAPQIIWVVDLLHVHHVAPLQPLQNHPSRQFKGGGRHRGRRRKYWMDNVEEWTPLPLPELNTMASRGEELMSISR